MRCEYKVTRRGLTNAYVETVKAWDFTIVDGALVFTDRTRKIAYGSGEWTKVERLDG